MRAHLSRRRPASKESRRRMRGRDRCSPSCPRIRRAAAARRAAMYVHSMQSASLSSSSRRWRRMRSSKMRLLMRLSSFCTSSPQRSSQSSAPAAMAAGKFGESVGARRADGLPRKVCQEGRLEECNLRFLRLDKRTCKMVCGDVKLCVELTNDKARLSRLVSQEGCLEDCNSPSIRPRITVF